MITRSEERLVEQHPFSGRGPGGEQPPPGGPAQDGVPGGAGDQVPVSRGGGVPGGAAGGLPAGVPGGPGDDWDPEAEMAAFLADIEAGRARIPEPWDIEGPSAAISLGDAADVDLAELAAMAGPDGLGGDRFAQDGAADVLRPGPVLAALTEQAAGELGRLSDNQLLGALSAARRLANRAEYLELSAIAEFTRRPAGLPGRGVRRRGTGHRAGHQHQLGPGPDGPGRRPHDQAPRNLRRPGRRGR